MSDNNIQLRPCPYCGAKAAEIETIKEAEECKHFEDEEVCPAFKPFEACPCKRIVCSVNRGGCGASTGFAWSIERAIEKWNRRPPIVVLDDDLK